MKQPSTYHCESQQRILRVLMSLFGHEINGLTPRQIATANGITPSLVTRDVWNLTHAGLVERVQETDAVRISPRLGTKALQIMAAFDQAQRQLSDLHSRYVREQ